MQIKVSLTLTTLIVLASLPHGQLRAAVDAPSADLGQQRDDYVAAMQALRSGDIGKFDTLYERLDGYILRNYLEYAFLEARIAATPPERIQRFLEDNDYAPISRLLRSKWLYRLAAEGDWEIFIKDYRHNDDDLALQCYRLRYLLTTREEFTDLIPEIKQLWLTEKRLPKSCNAVFQRWRETESMTEELVWARIQRLMEHGQLSLVRELAKYYLDAQQRVWVRRWQKMHREPARELKAVDYRVETPLASLIIRHGIRRLAYRDPEQAMAQWDRLKNNYPVLEEGNASVLRHIGTLAARRHLPVAAKWLSEITDAEHDETLRVWRLRAALRAGEWETAKRFVTTLTKAEQIDRFWWYWTARIMEQTNEATKARYMFALLATERNYYGFLAADRIGVDYTMQHRPVAVSDEEMAGVLAQPGIQAAHELYAVGDVVAARRQWSWSIRGMNEQELHAAARIASEWGWHDRAIYTLGMSRYRHDLDLRFPVLYRDLVESNAERYGLDPSWIYGVVRQESGFVVDARSSAGALGLMQLMPRVGRATGQRLKLKIKGQRAILNVENNLRLGTAFLKNMFRRYDGHQMLATAAYNAGPNRVRAWLPQHDSIDADVWVETIPYDETRDYVKNVMAYSAVYDHRLDRDPIRLCRRMRTVVPAKRDVVNAEACPLLAPAGGLGAASHAKPHSS